MLQVSRYAGLFGLVVGLVGCADPQPPVNRVQPNVVEKAAFAGEWYSLQTVIDTPYSASYTFVGEQGSLEKVVWEIQEELLIARRGYEHIADAEAPGIAGATESGAAIAMYRIESHFDIRREYNPVTGEELNVVGENTIDRPWNERAYMRVDWSENLVTNNDFLLAAKLFDGIRSEPVSYYVQDLEANHPHRPKFVTNETTGSLEYIDIVNKMFVEPTSVFIEGFGEVPTCFLMYQDHLDCAPGEIAVRNSFLKVDPAHDYQPFEYTGDRMDRFGYFLTERAGYDDHYGVVEPARYRFINRHNLWQQSHQRTEDGELKRCTATTADDTLSQCGAGGATCDLDLGKAERRYTADGLLEGACTIPYRERVLAPITYYVSENFPEDLLPDARHLTDEWNGAFTETVASLRVNECLADGGDDANCAEWRNVEDRTFVLCTNPVREGDHEACGAVGTVAPIGDLRYSLIGWVAEPHSSSPLGYGPSAADPETGEIIMGNAFVYGAAMETLETQARDIVALLNGDLSQDDLISGAQVEAWVDRALAPGSEVTGRPADDHVVPVDGYNVERINEAMDFSWARAHGVSADGLSQERPASVAEMLERFNASLDTQRRNGVFGTGEQRGKARLASLVGTEIERLMTNEEARLAAGVDPFRPLGEDVLDAASPLRRMSPENMIAMDRLRSEMQRHGCRVYADFADAGLLGLAREIKRAADEGRPLHWYGVDYEVSAGDGRIDYTKVREMLRHPIFDAVTAHEVGHTIGLRHNFSGSFDALNYHPRYWELRDDGNMSSRAFDPMTEEEIDGRILEYQYSTVMDYGNNFVVTDSVGIGHYDRAAVKMGYGDLVEVFDNATDAAAVNWYNFITTAGWPTALKLDAFTGGELSAYQYTDLPEIVGSREAMEQRRDVPYTSLEPDPFLESQRIDNLVQDPAGRPVVPYRFCSDEQRDLNPDCLLYDQGADAYETIQSVVDAYWNYYLFNAYRRERLGFSPDSYSSRVLNRYFVKLKYANQIYSLYRGIFEDIFPPEDLDQFMTREDGMGAWTAAVGAGYELLTRVVTTPEPGSYRRTTLGDGTTVLAAANVLPEVTIDSFDGRPLDTTWNFDDGYFWRDQLERVGYTYDKLLALYILADPEANFVGRDTAADVRRYQINFHTSFPGSVRGFFRGLFGLDWHTIGPRMADDGSLDYPDPLSLVKRDMDGTPIDPAASFTIQLYGLVYSMALLPTTFDQSYLSATRIFVDGGAEGVTLDEDIPQVEFTDRATGLTYRAASFPDEDGRETGVAAQMILHAQELDEAGADAELIRFVDNLNVVRQLSWQLGFGAAI